MSPTRPEGRALLFGFSKPDRFGAALAKVLMVVEDDPDVRQMIRLTLSADPRIEIMSEGASPEEGLEVARSSDGLGLIVLDHDFGTGMTGLQAAPLLKEASPGSKIILFTALDSVRVEALQTPSIDAYLLKTQVDKLLPLAQKLLGLRPD